MITVRSVAILAMLLTLSVPAFTQASDTSPLWKDQNGQPVSAPDTSVDYAAGAVVVRFADGTSRDRIRKLLAGRELDVDRYLDGLDAYIVKVPAGLERVTLEALERLPEVRYAERDGMAYGQLVPADSDYGDPLKVYAPQRIRAEIGWDFTTGSPEVVVAVIDTGLSLAHPEFAGRIQACEGICDFVNGDTVPADDQGHGTHVTGIIAAAMDGQGMVGIAPNVKILPVKVLDANNSGTWSNIAAGINYAVDQGAQVINLSLGGTSSSTLLRDAVQSAAARGIVVVAAAGNFGNDAPVYPAFWDQTIAVSATDQDDEWWSLSVHSPATDVSAPGTAIWSTYFTATDPAGYQFVNGTSMAAAHVSGLAALLLSQNPALTGEEVRALIQDSASDLGEPGWDPYFGAGRIDAGAALRASVSADGAKIWLPLVSH